MTAADAPEMIRLERLEKSFPGAGGPVPVLRGISLTVRRGEIFGIIGRSGAGKSTLIRCVNQLERASSGKVFVAGQELSALSGRELRAARRRIGMIFQHFNLLSSRTALENVALPLELAGEKKDAIRAAALPLLELVGLAGKADRHPSELSGGEKQRVGIARALASRPEVLLCDEATSALDPETTRSILGLLKDINRKLGLTIALITHEMAVIKEICDRVAVLDHGQVVEEGKVFDVFTAPQAEVTRKFLEDVVDRALPPRLRERLAAGAPGRGNPVIRVIFTGARAHDPIISEVVRRYDVLLNILQGSIEYIQEAPYGNLLVEAIGSDEAIAAALDYIRSNHLGAEILGHVAGDA
ncbi:methionine ABC transporter ATP-binding protein [Anaeromyxobacter paludicola]|uniref:Methionine import ATP-binding protein MetN n=1 Tax=Anaeromyxobacter paludicola TaxID=2918171 RepID=A0ABM7XDA1_9BACT|nr:methionine ABC transporter ATP-binding protein [Anaeromyxobacter paludicola]BDG09840.1 methionine import ATP-binding protein MetN [Anaeromyxobacter paludicola]